MRRFLKQTVSVTAFNFTTWRGSTRIFVTFALAFILCFLLSDKAMRFSIEYETTIQMLEPFIWTFGDANSILLASLLLLLLFADMPFLTGFTPYYLYRTSRKTWIAGQVLYMFLATAIYLVFILTATTLLCITRSFAGNLWSETAAILGYSGAGKQVALPTLVKTLELSLPYQASATIFVLMLLYSLFLASLMLFMHLRFGKAASVFSVFALSLYGFLLNPRTIQTLFSLKDYEMYRANVAVGWLSPLNHATYSMHNFGYDLLPRLWMSMLIFTALILFCLTAGIRAAKRYSFNFRGMEE